MLLREMGESPEAQGPASLVPEAVNHKETLSPQAEDKQHPKLFSDLHPGLLHVHI